MKDLLRTDGWLGNGLAQSAPIAACAFALCAGSFVGRSRVDRPVSKPESKSATEAGAVVHERKRPSGNVCRVELRGLISPHGIASALQELRISITNRDIHVPAEACTDLTHVYLRRRVQVADGESADRIACGPHCSRCRVVEREFTRGDQQPEVPRYSCAPVLAAAHPLTITNATITLRFSEPQLVSQEALP